MLILAALLIGVIAGLRSMAAPALASWAARLGWLSLTGTPLAFMGYGWTPWLLSAFALGELVNDKLPRTPTRTIPVQFATRVISGAWAGATLTGTDGGIGSGLVAGACGAVIGTLGGHRARAWLARCFGGQDMPAALLEDVVAIGGGFAILLALV